MRRPCLTCTIDGEPTGRRTVAWAQAVLDAMPREHVTPVPGAHPPGVAVAVLPGDQPTREALAVMADGQQASGDLFGEWLALWLARSPCSTCSLDGSAPGDGRMWDSTGRIIECPQCRGSGLELGAHTPAILEALLECRESAA